MWRSLPMLIAVGCGCNDIQLREIPNDPPEVAIFTHRDGDSLLEGYTARLGGNVIDDFETKSCTWYVDDVETCTGVPDDAGDCWCEWTAPLLDGVRIRFEAIDDADQKASQLLDLKIEPTDPPEVVIVLPQATRRYYDNTPVPMTGNASDKEDPPDLLAITWASDTEGALADAATTPDDRGVFTSDHLFAQGHHALTVTVTDGSGKTGTANVEIDVGGPNTPPTCEITFPQNGGEMAEFRDNVVAALVDDLDVPSDQLQVTFEDDVEGDLGETTPTVDGDVQFSVSGLSRGTHTITMTVTDDAGATCVDTVDVVVVEPPSAPVVHIDPQAPSGGEDLVCVIDSPSIDPQGDPLTYVFRWTFDGVEFTATTETNLPGDTVPALYTGANQVWECAASATDGKTEGSPGIDQVTIAIPSAVSTHLGTDHSCQLDTARQLICWGDASLNRIDLSGGYYTSVAGGFGHTCGVNLYGRIECSGLDTYGQVSGAPVTGGWEQVDSGDAFNCARDTSGRMTCWGENPSGQTNTTGLATYTTFSSGWRHSCAIRANGAMDCWGEGTFGRTTPTPGVTWSQVSAGTYTTCGLDTAGFARCFGSNRNNIAVPPQNAFDMISVGENFACGVRGNGLLECWGLGTGPGQPMEPPPGNYQWVDVGREHICAVDTAGVVTCWGEDSHGECDPPSTWW